MAYSDIRDGDDVARATADEWLRQAGAARAEALRARRATEELSKGARLVVEGAFVFEDAKKPWTAVHQNLHSPSGAAAAHLGVVSKDKTRQREVISRLRDRELRGEKTPASSPSKASAAATIQPRPDSAAVQTSQTPASAATDVPEDSGVFSNLSMQGPPVLIGLNNGQASETAAAGAPHDPFSAAALLGFPDDEAVGITEAMTPDEHLQGEELPDPVVPSIVQEDGVAVEEEKEEEEAVVAEDEDAEPEGKGETDINPAAEDASVSVVMPDPFEAAPEESAYELLMRELKVKREELSALLQQQDGTLQPSDQNKPEQDPVYQAVKPSHVKLLKGDLYSNMTPEQLESEKGHLQDVIADLEQRTLEAAQNSPMPSPSTAHH